MKTVFFALNITLASLAITATAPAAPPDSKPKPYRLPGTERMPQILWRSECLAPDGAGLSFGGEDQKAEDGAARTSVKSGDQWQTIHNELRTSNPLQPSRDAAWAIRGLVKDALAKARFICFEGAPAKEQSQSITSASAPLLRQASQKIASLRGRLGALSQSRPAPDDYHTSQIAAALNRLTASESAITSALARPAEAISAEEIKTLWQTQVGLELAAEALDAEPPPRALSPIVYDLKNKLFLVFGGDHLDYLTNDTWVFDPAKKTWRQRRPKTAPPPRANHQLVFDGEKIRLSGGYTYYNDIWYVGGPYVDLSDGEWTYDVAADAWTSEAGQPGIAPDSRVYRQKEFHPDFFLQGAKPDAAAFSAALAQLPVNTWVLTKPPHLPKMNRDWGTAVIDPDHDVLLRWSGGHSAHGGTDVIMFHLATNRWELPFPVEFPLGQTYSNSSYPDGVNFNLRPWVTGHTYKAYDYDPAGGMMVYVGLKSSFHLFDPVVAEWTGRGGKPTGMAYSGCYYDLLCKRTQQGIFSWSKEGRLFRYDGRVRQWNEVKTTGMKLPGSSVDSAGLDYDAKRNRLLLFPGQYAKPYSGQIIAINLTSMTTEILNPLGMTEAARMPAFQRESCYLPNEDIVLMGVTYPAGEDGLRWTPAYDCAANQWMRLKIGGPNPASKDGRNVSLGLVYDAKRNLIWAVDTNGNIHVLRLNLKSIPRANLATP